MLLVNFIALLVYKVEYILDKVTYIKCELVAKSLEHL